MFYLNIYSVVILMLNIYFQGDPGIEGPIGRPGSKVFSGWWFFFAIHRFLSCWLSFWYSNTCVCASVQGEIGLIGDKVRVTSLYSCCLADLSNRKTFHFWLIGLFYLQGEIGASGAKVNYDFTTLCFNIHFLYYLLHWLQGSVGNFVSSLTSTHSGRGRTTWQKWNRRPKGEFSNDNVRCAEHLWRSSLILTWSSLWNLQGRIGRIGAPGCKGDSGGKVSHHLIQNNFSLVTLTLIECESPLQKSKWDFLFSLLHFESKVEMSRINSNLYRGKYFFGGGGFLLGGVVFFSCPTQKLFLSNNW